jgi:hypothetical protein
MAFTIGSGTFTNGSATVTGVTLTSGTLAYFASGTRMVVGVNPVIQEVEAIAAPTVTTITLRSAWTGTGGTYSFLANQTSEGLRDAVQAIRSNNASLQSFIDSIDTAATADSVAQRTSDGSLNVVGLGATGDITLAAGGKIKFNDDRYFSPENNVDGAEISANGVFKVKTGATPSERFRIDSSGNVGINVTSPAEKLHIRTGSTYAATFNTTQGVSAETRISIGGFSNDAGGGNGSVSIGALHNHSANALSSMVFYNNGTEERMRIDSSGRLIVGATESAYNFRVNGSASFGDDYDANSYGQLQITRPAAQGGAFHLSFIRLGQAISGMGFLDNSSTFAIQNGGNNAANGVTLTVGATSWGTTSDERKKDIKGELENAIDKIANWRTVYFNYKNDDQDSPKKVGLIAQDVQKTLPEAVSVEEDEIGTLQLRYTEIIPVLIKAIQELKSELDEAKTRIQALEG